MSDYATNSKNGLFKEYNGSNRINMDDFEIVGNIMYKTNVQSTKISEIDLLIQELRDTIDNQRETIDRLNNIIDKLEKWLIKHIDEYRDMEQDAMFEFGLVLDKLKELKEE